jgi:hypothetical protein
MNRTENSRTVIGKTIRNRWFGALIACVSLGTVVAYLLWDRPKRPRDENAVDDRGTGQHKALQLLRNLRDRAFDADNGKLALALGRPEEDVRAWDAGLAVIDDDVVMKARGIALHRDVDIG